METRAEPVDLSPLPSAYQAAFVEQLAANDALRARVESLTESNRRMEHLISELRRFIYGRKSEKLGVDERQLAFEDLEGAVGEVQAATEPSAPPSPPTGKRRARRNIGQLPEHLERIERVIEPDSTECPCGCGQMVRIGEDRSERLDIVPATLRVIVTVRPKYACRTCEQGVVQAAAPAHLIEGGLPTEAMLAQVLISKYADHLPLYRQSQLYARSGVDLHRSTLAGWVGKAAFHLLPVVDRLAWHLKQSGHLFMDETRAPVLDPGRGKTKTGYLWALARDERPWAGPDPPGVVFFYAPGRGGRHAEGFPQRIRREAARRRLCRLQRGGGARQGGWSVVSVGPTPGASCARSRTVTARRSPPKGCGASRRCTSSRRRSGVNPAEVRLAVRQTRTAPLIEDFGVWLRQQRARVSPKSRLGEKLAYIGNHWDGLQVFLTDGRVEMDNNVVENAIRPLALNRKNALFAGHDEGAAAWGRIASLVETAKMNRVNPHAYLKATLEAIANGHPASEIDQLLPWAFTPISN